MINIIRKFKSNLPDVVPPELFDLHYQKDSRFIEDKITDLDFYKRFLKSIFEKRKFESHDFFNPDILVECLTNIKLKDGYTLDFVYQTANRIGLPLLYVRKIETKSFIKVKQHDNWLNKNSLLDYILVDGTKDSYIQLIIFMELGNKFFLYDHALYNEIDLILSIKDFNDIFIKYNFILDPNQLEKIKNLSFNPQVKFVDNSEIQVTYYVFSKFEGIFEKSKVFYIKTKLGIKKEINKCIIPYKNSIFY